MTERFGGVQPLRRVEDLRLITGGDRFVDNLRLDGALHLVFLRSPHPHAEILAIDADAARSAPGVVAVLTGADLAAQGVEPYAVPVPLKRPDGAPMSAPPRQPLATGRVRFVGEAVAAVIAETEAAALDAAELIAVEYRELPALVDIAGALSPGAPEIWPGAPGNIAAEMRHGDEAATAAAFDRAAHVTRRRLVNNRLVPAAMEPRAALAEFDAASGRVTLHACTQNPTAVRQFLAQHVLKCPPEQVRVVVRDIGGGFGMKSHLYPEDGAVAFAARMLRRPVRWRAGRGEEFLAGSQGRDQISEAELALDAEGRILALRVRTLANIGAAPAPASAAVPLVLGPKVLTSVYRVPVFDVRCQAVLTNTVTVGPYRGAGRPEAVYLMERLIDAAAREMAIDPAEMRRRNLVPAEAMPYTNPAGETYDCGDFAGMLERCLARADWDGFAARRAEAARRGRLYGRGLGLYIEWTGANQFTEKVAVLVEAEGRVVVRSATQAMGQGLETVYTQLAAAALQLPPERIGIVQGDTDLVQGFGSMASRSLFTGGSAVQAGAHRTIEECRRLAAEVLEAAEADIAYEAGRFRIVGTDRSIGLFELAATRPEKRIEVAEASTVQGGTWPNGAHVCEVEIDPETGVARIARYTTVDDVGRPINEAIVLGQVQGGIVQGIGQALMEHCIYDQASGQLLTGSFMDYAMPRADDVPALDCSLDTSLPTSRNPLGAKGCGESGTVGALATVMNAIHDALAERGVAHLDMPATPARIWRALQDS
ncbi:MAG: xanthine dehydrogenase family protein molybdopterin-binding subunit [Alphaproteobacteria bacterium]|nr:xanthine dehydrogenase family protein molybdopterin-binding subunit [Alphaproteobacteria bacterium]